MKKGQIFSPVKYSMNESSPQFIIKNGNSNYTFEKKRNSKQSDSVEVKQQNKTGGKASFIAVEQMRGDDRHSQLMYPPVLTEEQQQQQHYEEDQHSELRSSKVSAASLIGPKRLGNTSTQVMLSKEHPLALDEGYEKCVMTSLASTDFHPPLPQHQQPEQLQYLQLSNKQSSLPITAAVLRKPSSTQNKHPQGDNMTQSLNTTTLSGVNISSQQPVHYDYLKRVESSSQGVTLPPDGSVYTKNFKNASMGIISAAEARLRQSTIKKQEQQCEEDGLSSSEMSQVSAYAKQGDKKELSYAFKPSDAYRHLQRIYHAPAPAQLSNPQMLSQSHKEDYYQNVSHNFLSPKQQLQHNYYQPLGSVDKKQRGNVVPGLNKSSSHRLLESPYSGSKNGNHHRVLSPTEAEADSYSVYSQQQRPLLIQQQSTNCLLLVDGQVLQQQLTPRSSSQNSSAHPPPLHQQSVQEDQFTEQQLDDQSQLIMSDEVTPIPHINQEFVDESVVVFSEDSTPSVLSRKIPMDKIFAFMIAEEEHLSSLLHFINIGQLNEITKTVAKHGQLSSVLDYEQIMKTVDTKKERPRLFAKQLQITLVSVNALVKAFTQSGTTLSTQLQLQRYGQKLRTVYSNCHQCFLIMTDLVLCSPLCNQLSPKENAHHIYLKRLVGKKLKCLAKGTPTTPISKQTQSLKRSQKLMQFRQNNEVSILNVKKICKAIKNPNGASLIGGGGIEGRMYNNSEQLVSICDHILDMMWNCEMVGIHEAKARVGLNEVQAKGREQSMQQLQSPSQKSLISPVFKTSQPSNQRKSQSPLSKQMMFSPKTSADNISKVKAASPRPIFKRSSSPANSDRSFCSSRSGGSPSERSIQAKHNFNGKPSQKIKTGKLKPLIVSQKQVVSPTILPETLAFIVANSLDNAIQQPQTRGITNINNTINIYSTQTTNVIQTDRDTSSSYQSNIAPYNTASGESDISRCLSPNSKDLLKKQSKATKQTRKTSSKKILKHHLEESKILDYQQHASAQLVMKSKHNSDLLVVPKQIGKSRPQSRVKEQPSSKLSQLQLHQHQKMLSDNFVPFNQEEVQYAIPVCGGSTGKAKKKTTKKHNFDQQRLLTKEQMHSQRKQNVTQINHSQSKSNITDHSYLDRTERAVRKSELNQEETRVQVYKLSSNFIKQYKPMIQGKGSKYQIEGSSAALSTATKSSQAQPSQQVVVSKKKTAESHRQKYAETPGHKPSNDFMYSPGASNMRLSELSGTGLGNQHHFSSTLNKGEIKKSNFNKSMKDTKAQAFKHTLAQALSEMAQKGLSYGLDPSQSIKSNQDSRSQDFQRLLQLEDTVLRHKKNEQQVLSDDENPFQREEDRLDSLLTRMQEPDESTGKKIKAPQGLHFGELFERSITNHGGLDLKKEMEILQSSSHNRSGDVIDISAFSTPETLHEPPNQLDSPVKLIMIPHDNQVSHHEESPKSKTPSHAIATTEERNKKNSSKTEMELQRLKALVTIPYLPPLQRTIDERPVYTLVLDLDETLIHLEQDEENEDENNGEDEIYYLIRPGAIRFINELAKYFEIVIFTAAMPDYADWIMDNIDRHRVVEHRLYRQHTSPHEDYAIKDLRNLGRPLERTIIIDNLAENFMFTTPTNGIWVESWYDDMDDNILELLTPFLKGIVTSGKVPDVRKVLTEEIKEKVIYKCLEEGREIPSIDQLIKQL